MPRFLALGVVVAALGISSLTAQQPSSAVGLWQTEGYGLVFDVRPDSVIGYEITKVSCMPTTRAVTSATPPAGALGAFSPPGTPVTFVILPGKTPNDARVHLAYAASDMIVHRIDRKPTACDAPTPNTPLSNFDVFAQTWAEQYGFFREKKVDWAAVVAANRPRVTDATTPEQLFDIISRDDLAAAGRTLLHWSAGDQQALRWRQEDPELPRDARGTRLGVCTRVRAPNESAAALLRGPGRVRHARAGRRLPPDPRVQRIHEGRRVRDGPRRAGSGARHGVRQRAAGGRAS